MSAASRREYKVKGNKDVKEVPRIWNLNPSYKHSNLAFLITRIIIITLISILYCTLSYLLIRNLYIALTLGVIILTIFLLTFSDVVSTVIHFFRGTRTIKPFNNIKFFMEKKNGSTIYLTNTKDNRHVGLKIFKINVIPENIHANMNQFIKALSEYRNMIPFTYQIIQSPVIPNSTSCHSMPIITSIYFCIYHTVSGTLRAQKFRKFVTTLHKLGGVFKSNLVANFHHFQIALLWGTSLLNAMRTYFFQTTHTNISDTRRAYHPILTISILIKSTILIILICLSLLFLSSLQVPLLYILVINLGIVVTVICFWWRELLFIISARRLLKQNTCIYVDPFFDIRFFTVQRLSDTLFAYTANEMLLGLKMYNLTYAFSPLYCHPDKFIQGLMNQKISFGYTCMNTPISYDLFYKKGLDYLNEKTRFTLLKSPWRMHTRLDEINWLSIRSGIWSTILTLSTSEIKLVDSLSKDVIYALEEQLALKAEIMYNAFNINFMNFRLIQLRRNKLRSGVKCELLKTPQFSIHGSRLNYILLQGKTLIYLTEIKDELKKGITTRIPSEFNTPLQLENNIILGNTINTEVFEEEMPFGFTLEQVRNLLILNGRSSSRDLMAMKIVAELVEQNIPSLIFDFKGNWSKLIDYFRDTQFQDDFLYFKLGSAFSLDPLTSDIPYDKDNVSFMNMMFDAYALAFKKKQTMIEAMRKTIINNPEMDRTTLNLKLTNLRPWEKEPGSDALISLFGDFSQQDEQYLHLSTSQPTEKGVITFQQFINNEKTIILDLSISDDYTKQMFLVFLILSKIIHYARSPERKVYIPKMVVVPHIDLFFENYWIDKYSDYGKINKFLDPLIDSQFGFIFMGNQAHYIHDNLYNYFKNMIVFRAQDNRDIAALSSFMNLQELEGIGYYSRTRNQTYQVRYLMNMQDDEAIVKREDMYQAFPVRFDWNEIAERDLWREDEIIDYMKKQGINIKDTERMIFDQVKKTLFKKDLRIYESFTNEVKQFLSSMSTIDQVGSLYEKKLKRELKAILHPKASKLFKTKVEIKKCRDDIFNILVKHGYLVENHPRTAGGSESLRTSYSVGEQYQKALKDEFASKQDFTVEALEQESEIPLKLPPTVEQIPRKYIIQGHNLKKAIAREYPNFFFELFTAHEYITKAEFKQAIRIERDLILRFLTEIYKHYHNADKVVDSELDRFLEEISSEPSLDFTTEELKDYIDKYRDISFENIHNEQLTLEMDEFVSRFFDKIQKYHFHKEED